MILFMLAVTIPIGAIWLCSGWILAALVPEKAIAHLAGYYLSLLLAGAPGYAIFEAGKRFTQAQGLFNASLFVLLIATPINIALNYVFVFVLDWDLTGAALATVISNNLLPLLLWIYVYFVNPSSLECWGGFTKAAFTNWGPMAKLAVPGIVMVETEWLAFVSSGSCICEYRLYANFATGHSYFLDKLSFHSPLGGAVDVRTTPL
jgi:MATE family multidrug resistance protein